MELLKVDSLEEALEKLIYNARGLCPDTETVDILHSYGRVLAEDIVCCQNVPGFRRSSMDGYAVISDDTRGAGESMPVFLTTKGQVEMGTEPGFSIERGQCAYVPTGGMIPEGAEAVVMEEYCEQFADGQIGVYQSLAGGTNVVQADEDISAGEKALNRGRTVKSQDMGLMASIGIPAVKVFKPWSVYIISTGDELVSPEEMTAPGKVRDVNTYGLAGMVKDMGFEIAGFERTQDDEILLEEAVRRGKEKADMVIVSGGSSKGQKDATAKVLDRLSSSGVFTHGIAIKPGKPTILAVDEPSKSVMIGLPGHPVAALIVFRQIAGGLWNCKTGAANERWTLAKLSQNLHAAPGRKTFQLVNLKAHQDGNVAVPVLAKSGLIYSMSRADGYMVIERNQEGLTQGQWVKVYYI